MRTLPLLCIIFLSSCSLIPSYQRPEITIPEGWKNTAPTQATTINSEWWKMFGSEELNSIIQQGLQNNTDMRIALARVEQARASANISASPLWPSVDASAGANRNDTDKTSASNTYRAQLSVAYEVDIFGRNRANYTAAQAALSATGFDSDAVAIIVASDIAQAYFDILSLRDQLRISRENLANVQEVLTIVEARFNEGLTSGLEVAQQRAQLQNTSAQLAEQERQLNARENSLATLLGIAPTQLTLQGVSLAAISSVNSAAPVPSQLLEARPDIKSAEANLLAANADIGAARAAFFPTLDLGASLGQAFNPANLATALTASVLAPIFHGGAIRGGLELSEARQREVAENYRKTVLTSFQEVENALASIRSADTRQHQLYEAQAESKRAYDLSREQYAAGAIDFQALLDTQRSLLQSDNAYNQARLEVLSASLALIKATGAGWQPTNAP